MEMALSVSLKGPTQESAVLLTIQDRRDVYPDPVEHNQALHRLGDEPREKIVTLRRACS